MRRCVICGQCGKEFILRSNIRAKYKEDGLCSRCRWKQNNTKAVAKYRKANTKRAYAYNLKSKYGITLEEYQEILNSQDGVCAICGIPPGQHGRKHLSVDHDHNTTKIRGLICNTCNTMLGYGKDDPEVLRRGALYLEGQNFLYKYYELSLEKTPYYKGPDKKIQRYEYDQLRRTGLTLNEYSKLLEEQGGHCAICGRIPSRSERRLAVDHDHKTGEYRGLLCHACNRMLGYATDRPNVLRLGAEYLEKQE